MTTDFNTNERQRWLATLQARRHTGLLAPVALTAGLLLATGAGAHTEPHLFALQALSGVALLGVAARAA